MLSVCLLPGFCLPDAIFKIGAGISGLRAPAPLEVYPVYPSWSLRQTWTTQFKVACAPFGLSRPFSRLLCFHGWFCGANKYWLKGTKAFCGLTTTLFVFFDPVVLPIPFSFLLTPNCTPLGEHWLEWRRFWGGFDDYKLVYDWWENQLGFSGMIEVPTRRLYS